MNRTLKRIGIGIAGLLVLVVLLGSAAVAYGSHRIARTYDVTPATLTLASDSATVARGAHLSRIYGCTDCHGADLAGTVMVDDAVIMAVAPNLTPAGVGASYTATDWDRAIRHGVRPSGRSMFIMPSKAYHGISDDEAAALIAYLSALPAVENALPATKVRLPGRLLAAGPIDPSAGVITTPTRATAPAPGATVEYGEYVATMMCAYCHGADLRGAVPADPASPPAPDIVVSGQWPADVFHTALTTGVTITGRQMSPQFMPWTATAAMTPEEREGIRLYLASLAPTRG